MACVLKAVGCVQESVHFAKRAKLESLRKAFVEASITPNHRMEDMWRAYRNFEQGNPATVRLMAVPVAGCANHIVAVAVVGGVYRRLDC